VRSMAAGAVTHERNADRYLGSSMPMLVRAMGRFRVIVIMILHPLHVVQVTVVVLRVVRMLVRVAVLMRMGVLMRV
jgi:ABC-type multidrug transport system permease subunit